MNSLTPALLLQAYRHGIFPMAQSADDAEIFWVDPELRGIIPLDHFHIAKKLARTIRREPFTVTCDEAFSQVIEACASPEPDRKTTWISKRLSDLYQGLHEDGFAHSIECWKDGELAGGLYGVAIGGAFCGESMFHRHTDASKIALVYLVARLKFGGFRLLDTQFITPHLQQFGAYEITRKQYAEYLCAALSETGDFYLLDEDASAGEVLQAITQTS
jgi:leucyl/phenylalanyl-tRNA--protein transferase